MPAALAGPSAIAARDWAREASRAAALPGRKVNRVRWAAAMAAASGEDPRGAAMVPRYGSYSLVMELTASKTASCTIALQRVWKLGLVGGTATVACMISFQSVTASPCAA